MFQSNQSLTCFFFPYFLGSVWQKICKSRQELGGEREDIDENLSRTMRLVAVCDAYQLEQAFWTPLRRRELMTRYTKLDSTHVRDLILLIYELDRIYLMTRLNSNDSLWSGEIWDAIVATWMIFFSCLSLYWSVHRWVRGTVKWWAE